MKKIFGALFLLQGRKKAVGGRQKKVPDLFFFFFFFFLRDTKNFRGALKIGRLFRAAGGRQVKSATNVTPLSPGSFGDQKGIPGSWPC